MPTAVPRNAFAAFRHRFTLRQTRRTVPTMPPRSRLPGRPALSHSWMRRMMRGSPVAFAWLAVYRCYGVQHHRYPLGSIVHDLPVREFTTTVEPVYGAGT